MESLLCDFSTEVREDIFKRIIMYDNSHETSSLTMMWLD
jgi:hypothetical protein